MKLHYLFLIAFYFLISCKQEPQQTTQVVEKKNETIETIMNRRSIRAYKPEQITGNQLDTLIQCAINAPSALNKQSWEVRIIQNPELLKAINEGFVNYAKDKNMQGSASKAQDPGFSVFHNAPTLILVAKQSGNSYSEVDCGLLGQNILLAAESMNIGTCVVGSVLAYLNTPEGKQEILPKLGLSEGYELLYTIAVGYKNEQPEAKPRDRSKVQVIQ